MVMFVFPLGCMLMNFLLTMTYANSSGLVAHTSPEPMCLHQRIDPLTSSANSFSVMIYSCASDSSRLSGLLWYLASSLKRDKYLRFRNNEDPCFLILRTCWIRSYSPVVRLICVYFYSDITKSLLRTNSSVERRGISTNTCNLPAL